MAPSPKLRSSKKKSASRSRASERTAADASPHAVDKKRKQPKPSSRSTPDGASDAPPAHPPAATADKKPGVAKPPDEPDRKENTPRSGRKGRTVKRAAKSAGGDADAAKVSLDAAGDEARSLEDGFAAVKREAKKAKRRSGSKEKTQETPKVATRVKKTGAAAKASIVNKFSLEPDEQPAKKSKKAKATRRAPPGESPDVVLNRRMTKDKLSLLTRSPLSHLVSEEDKDAAAQQVYGQGASFSTHVKRKLQNADVDEIIPLDSSQPPKKKSKDANADAKDLAELVARRKERRIEKRRLRKLRKSGAREEESTPTESGVMYLAHIPHGFYEEEIRGYFAQFGRVTAVRLSRSKKTARSRGYAFIEFEDTEIAQKAAESMDGYLMHGQKLVAKVVPPERLHPETMKGAERKFKKVKFSTVMRNGLIRRSRDPLKLAQRSKHVQKKLHGKKARLEKMGLKYQFPEIASDGQ